MQLCAGGHALSGITTTLSKLSAECFYWPHWVSQVLIDIQVFSVTFRNTVLGAIDAHQSCQPPKSTLYITSGDAALGIGLSAIPGVLLEGIPIGIATCVFSFSLNTLATLLVAYKAWYVWEINIGYGFHI